MSNEYPQVAVLGCDSRKANLYYDLDRRAWVEHLASPCVNNEQSILEFCQQVISFDDDESSQQWQLKLFIIFILSRFIRHFVLVISFDWTRYYVSKIGVS